MIPKTASVYCWEDISLIENYELALNDKTQTWVCHHRLEIELQLTANDLIAMGLYWKRPASELIFLTKSEHRILHNTGKSSGFKDKHHTEEAKAKQSKAHKGKQHTEESKAKMSAAKKGRNGKAVYQIHEASGIIIREWKCIREAARVLGLHATHIVQCCKGKLKSTGGYIWRYVDVH